MNIDNRFLVLLLAVAAAAAVGTAIASKSRLRHRRTTRDQDHKQDLKSWENEGGNLAPAAVSPAQP